MKRSIARESTASTVVFDGPLVGIGKFRAPPGHARWSDENCIGDHCIVFPRVPVGIHNASDRPVIADPTMVMLYNRGDRYQAECLTERGDECEWFRVDPQTLRDALRTHDPAVDDRADRILPYAHSRCLAPWYARQRALFERCRASTRIDPLWVEENFLALLEDIVPDVLRIRSAPGPGRAAAQRADRELVREARIWLGRNYAALPSLAAAANAVGASVFHLCRRFRAETGMTIHQFVTRLRLSDALQALSEGRPLCAVAMECGFCSQSHFTDGFRRMYGVPPAQWRRALANPRE